MADVSRSEGERPREPRLSLGETWRRLNFEQRAAAVGAVLLIVSTLGPFSFVEAAIIITGAGVLVLLRKRAEGKLFHVPFGDGAVIAAAGAWSALLIFIRIADRPLGQGLLAMVCAGIVLLAGLRERAKRPPDDLPEGVAEPGTPPAPPPDPEKRQAPPGQQATAETQALPAKVLPPATPQGRRASGEQPPLWDEPTD
jgi:hypothetical protein